MSLENAINALVSRLETVTSRLEKVENQLASGAISAPSAGASSGGGGGASGGNSASVADYDNLINAHIRPLAAKSTFAPEVQEQVNLLVKAVEAQRDFLAIAAASKKPNDQVLQSLIAPTSELMGQIVSLRDSKRQSKFFNNLSTISEGIGALGWVMVSPTPGPHVADMRGGSEFYSNRILKDFKGKDQAQVDWVHDFNTFLKELQAFIKNHHTTGLSWNPNGGDAASAKPGASSAPKASAGGPPPPPAGGPPPPPSGAPPPAATKGPDMNALFGALNKGTDVTSGLKKVTDSQKAKNMKDVPVLTPQQKEAAAAKAASAKKETPKKPARLELDGNKWIVEYFVDRKDLVISETETRHAVYICGLSNSTVVIKGKVNSVAIDSCKRTGVVLENAISGVELVNCTSVEVQVLGKVPSVAIDKTSGVQLYLSKDALEAEIVTSKSSEMNIMIPGSGDVDQIELPLPEQYKTLIKGSKLVTECVQHSG